MSTGAVSTPAGPGGAFDASRVNFYCLNCRRFVLAPPGADSMRECPTPGCRRPTGFGGYAKVPWPRRRA